MEFVIKFKLDDEIRRITFTGSDLTFANLQALATKLFNLKDTNFTLKYLDEDNDYISISSDIELHEAVKVYKTIGKQALMIFLIKTTQQNKPSPVPSVSSSSSSSSSSNANAFNNLPFLGSFLNNPEVVASIQGLMNEGQTSLGELAGLFQSLNLNPEKLELNNLQSLAQQFFNNLSGNSATPDCNANANANADVNSNPCNAKEEVKEEQNPSIHYGVTCDGCGSHPIEGKRFKCNNCPDYDLCEKCKGIPSIHDASHTFTGVKIPPTVHFRIQCDGCGVHPIVGQRFKCNVCPNYDLCQSCKVKPQIHDASHTFVNVAPRYCHPWGRRALHQQQQQQSSCPTSNPTPGHCPYRRGNPPSHLARFVSDVTVNDGTIVAPGANFTKIWRMRNEGPSAWPENTCLIFVSGDRLSKLESVILPPVPSQSEIEISVDMTAPFASGRYVSYWRLATSEGNRFGQKIWVDIIVEDVKPQVQLQPQVIPAVVPEPVKLVEEPKKEEVIKKEEEKPKSPELIQLLSMGFKDEAHLERLLKKNNNDVLQTIQELLQ